MPSQSLDVWPRDNGKLSIKLPTLRVAYPPDMGYLQPEHGIGVFGCTIGVSIPERKHYSVALPIRPTEVALATVALMQAPFMPVS
jgi:hypothetical protein